MLRTRPLAQDEEASPIRNDVAPEHTFAEIPPGVAGQARFYEHDRVMLPTYEVNRSAAVVGPSHAKAKRLERVLYRSVIVSQR